MRSNKMRNSIAKVPLPFSRAGSSQAKLNQKMLLAAKNNAPRLIDLYLKEFSGLRKSYFSDPKLFAKYLQITLDGRGVKSPLTGKAFTEKEIFERLRK